LIYALSSLTLDAKVVNELSVIGHADAMTKELLPYFFNISNILVALRSKCDFADAIHLDEVRVFAAEAENIP
jgi:hypothetical protein